MINANLTDFKSRTISTLTQLSITYSLAQRLFLYYFRGHDPSFQNWLHFYLQQFKEACQRKKPVVWASIYTPSELLYALDVIPLYPEMISASVASIGLANYFMETAECHFYLPDLCSFYRVASGMFLKKCLPRPDMIISTSQLCDGSVKFFRNASRFYRCDYFLIDPPYESNQKTLRYLADELKNLGKWVEKRTGNRISHEALRKSLQLANQSRSKMQEMNQLREKSPAPLSGWNALAYILYMYFSSFGSFQGVSFYDTLLQEVQENAEQSRETVQKEEIRILWLHQLRPYYPTIILKILSDYGAVIAFEEMSQIYWSEHNLERPFLSLAEKIVANPGVGPISRRISMMLKLVERYHIDGVIHFNQRGCRQSCGGAPLIKEVLKQQNIPMLILDGDGIDIQNYSEGQTRTRLEAFLEMIG